MINLITFEQPVNETIRICLRLEQLQQQFHYFLERENPNDCKTALGTLLETLKLALRPDLKSKLTQVLAQYNASLSQLHLPPETDRQLQDIRKKIDSLTQQLHNTHGRIGESLRAHEFLSSLILQTGTPSGICESSSAAYALWLRQPFIERNEQLLKWYETFQLLNQTMQLILFLTRESNLPITVVAKDGFFQQSLAVHPPCQMIRVSIPIDMEIYPEMSVGKYRLAVHFLTPLYSTGVRPQQYRKDVEMQLTCCQL